MICFRFIRERGAAWAPEARQQKLHRVLLQLAALAPFQLLCVSGVERSHNKVPPCILPFLFTSISVTLSLPAIAANRTVLSSMPVKALQVPFSKMKRHPPKFCGFLYSKECKFILYINNIEINKIQPNT